MFAISIHLESMIRVSHTFIVGGLFRDKRNKRKWFIHMNDKRHQHKASHVKQSVIERCS